MNWNNHSTVIGKSQSLPNCHTAGLNGRRDSNWRLILHTVVACGESYQKRGPTMMTSANPSFTWKTPIKFSMAALLALVIDLVGGLYLIGLPLITSRGQ